MSLVILKLKPGPRRVIMIAAALFLLVGGWLSLTWNFVNMIAARTQPGRPEARIIGEWLAGTSPSDPQAHTAAGLAFERSFDMGDVERSLHEYEAAAANAPYDYVRWLDLARARSLAGDEAGNVTAARRALELAPNYATVQWAFGNTLLRQGNSVDGFPLLAKAAAAKPEYSRPAALTALEMLNGDVETARNALGGSDAMTAALADALAAQKRFDEAADLWSRLPADGRSTKFAKLGEALRDQLLSAKRFRLAARISADIWPTDDKPLAGRITNGGFESEVKLRDAAPFDWQIPDGPQPVIGIATGQAFAGQHNLFLLFDSFESAAFRQVSQTVAVEPGGSYELTLNYRSDIKSTGELKFEAANACDLTVIAATSPLSPAGGWTPFAVRFTVPTGCDGVIIRLNRDGCAGPTCPMSGRLAVDEVALRGL